MKTFWLLSVLVLAGVGARGAASVDLSTGTALSTATLTCDELDYFTEANRLEARGNAVLTSSGTRLRADALTLVQSGHDCIGCSEPKFWDRGGLYQPLPAPTKKRGRVIGIAAAGGGVLGAGAAVVARQRIGQGETNESAQE